jgi:hypothetical protein
MTTIAEKLLILVAAEADKVVADWTAANPAITGSAEELTDAAVAQGGMPALHVEMWGEEDGRADLVAAFERALAS